MRLVLISDTHGLHDLVKLPEGDTLVHAGDLTSVGKIKELQKVAEWLNNQIQFKHIVAIGGNHDWILEAFKKEERERELREGIFKRVHYLRDSSVTLGGVKFYGSPDTPWFFNWAFNLQRGAEIAKKWSMIPWNTDVLVTHGPPMGILDHPGGFGPHVGCDDLLKHVELIKPKVHVFGHIHGSYGKVDKNGTQFFNASQVNEAYRLANEPLVTDI